MSTDLDRKLAAVDDASKAHMRAVKRRARAVVAAAEAAAEAQQTATILVHALAALEARTDDS